MATTNSNIGVDPKIADPLGKLKGIIRRYVTIESFLALALFAVAWFWIAMMLDYGVFQLFAFDWAVDAHRGFRVVALIIASAFFLALLLTKLFIRLTRDFSQESLAMVLERRHPQLLGDRLITAVQLTDLKKAASYGYSIEMIKKTIDDARDRIDQVNVKQVFNWKRLWRQAFVFLGLSVGLFVLSGVAICAITRTKPAAFVNRFNDVSTILAERDLFLKKTPWPRRAYIEVVNFEGNERRIGRDASSPLIQVAAYQWVIADDTSDFGWRPLTWADVSSKLSQKDVPALPLQELRDSRQVVTFGTLLFGASHPFKMPEIPRDVAEVPEDSAAWKVDRVKQVFVDNEQVKTLLAAKHGETLTKIESIFTQLDQLAAKSSMTRTLRKLDIPKEVELFYSGVKTSVDMKMRPEQYNEFSATMTDLKESVEFYTRGENFDTPTRKITLVPAPTLQLFQRDEYHPAYLYHKPPFVDPAGLPSEMKPYATNPQVLQGKKHLFKDLNISLTGEKSRIDIPAGTDLVLRGKADKPLVEAAILPKQGKFPGKAGEVENPDPIPLKIVDNGFSFTFNQENNTQITRETVFELFLKDTDNVTSKRLVQVIVEEDRPPDVNVAVDIIRKVGDVYLCTARAILPFTKDSKVRDDRGLNRVDMVYTYAEVEPQAIVNQRASTAAWVLNNLPAIPNHGSWIYGVVASQQVAPYVGSERTVVNSRAPLGAFSGPYQRNVGPSMAELDKRLTLPRPQGPDDQILKSVEFRGLELDPDRAFDLEVHAPGLARREEKDIQRTYLLNLAVEAVDTNVEGGKPGTTLNTETFTFKIVSDGELLTEIGLEEQTLVDKLDDAIARLRKADSDYLSMAARFSSLSGANADFSPEKTRSTGILELIAKSRDVVSEVNTDYSRLALEYRANRLQDSLIAALTEKVIRPLNSSVSEDFPNCEAAVGRISQQLSTNIAPNVEESRNAQLTLTTLINKLENIRRSIREGQDLKNIQAEAERIRDALIRERNAYATYAKDYLDGLEQIRVQIPNAAVAVVSGGELKVSLTTIVGAAYLGSYEVKLVPTPGSEITVPASVKVDPATNKLEFTIKAGSKKSTGFSIRLVPDIGPTPPRELKVIVQ
ncbi:MAG: hypothetical protein R3B84_15840 [Zavarzinella sp.]